MQFNEVLTEFLTGRESKADWCGGFIAAFGSSRRMIGLKDGTPFSDVALTGTVTTSGGDITGFGKTSDATVQLAADLMTGTNVLRFAGNGAALDLTLGLTEDAQIAAHMVSGMTLAQAQAAVVHYDVMLPSNPTSTSGIALSSTFRIRAPAELPSGTGPAAPPLDANAITAFRMITYNADETVATTGPAIQIDVREPDVVMDRHYMAREMGDVRKMRVADGAGAVIGTGGDCYRFAATTRSMNAVVNSEANVPLHQVQIRAKPHGRWASYPFQKDLNTAYDTLIPPAHKMELLRADGSVAEVIEMYSTRVNNVPGTGWPVNSMRIKQDRFAAAVRAYWTCGMQHVYQSHKPKMHSLAQHFFPGVEDDAFNPKNVSELASSPQCWPIITGKATYNGLGVWRVAPKWSRMFDGGCDTTIIDSGMVQISKDGYTTQFIGYGFEPGATCQHTWYMAPGGPRHDRAAFPTAIVTWVTRPNGVRVHGAVPYVEMAHHWMMGYFNHHQHYYTDLERGIGIPKSKVLNAEVCYQDVYYRGGSENYRPDIQNNGIRLFSAVNQNDVGAIDKNGRRFTNEYSRDYMHNQSNAAIGAYIGCSAMHVESAAHSFASIIMAAFPLSQSFNRMDYLTRQHAWYEKGFVEMWMVACNDPASFTTNEIESMAGRHLERLYDSIYPYYASGTDIYSITLRNLGMISEATTDGVNTTVRLIEDSKSCYFGQVLMLMKQSGYWDAMRARSAKCAAALDMLLDCCTKYAVLPIAQADGRTIDKYNSEKRLTYPNSAPVDITGYDKFYPPNGQEDWIRGANGLIGSGETDNDPDGTNTKHFRAQQAKIIADCFPEKVMPEIAVAMGKYRQWYADVDAGWNARTSQYWKHRFPMQAFIKAPDYVGAPV